MTLRVDYEELELVGFDAGGGEIFEYQGLPFTGFIEERIDGILVSEEEFTNGHRGGVQRSYYKNGQLKEEYYIYFNKMEGRYRKWDKAGNVILSGYFKNGEKVHPSMVNKEDIDDTVSLLKQYIKDHLNSHGDDWEYEHEPHIGSVIGSLNERQSKEFSDAILGWDESLLSEIARPMIFANNKHIKSNYLYCLIFSKLSDMDSLTFLAENLAPCFYSLRKEEYDKEIFREVRLKLLLVLERTTDHRWEKTFGELLYELHNRLSS